MRISDWSSDVCSSDLTARALTLFAAHGANTAAIDTVFPAIKDEAGLGAYAARARRDGFTGMMAIHPSQVGPINAAFTPSTEEVARAQAIVDAFAANPGVGVDRKSTRLNSSH